MDVDALATFVAVARRGSFAAVARDLRTDPSAVSRSIALLERELGLRLFQRSTRRMTLTDAGDRYLARVGAVLEELERAREEARAAEAAATGTLRLTTSTTFGHIQIVPLLPEIRAAFPNLQLELLLTDARLDLVAERVDLAIRLGAAMEPGLVGVKLFDMRYEVCASPAYLAAHGAPQRPAELARHRCVLYSLAPFRTAWRFRAPDGAVEEVPVAGDLVLSTQHAVLQAACLGLGPALLPRWLSEADIAAGRLQPLLPGHEATATDFAAAAWLLYPNRSFLPARTRLMADFLRRRLR